MRGKSRQIVLATSLAVFLILVCFFFSYRKEYTPNSSSDSLTTLPKFSATDFFGNEVNSKSLLGKKSFVQFINPTLEIQKKSFIKTCNSLMNDEFNIVVFLKPSEAYIFDNFIEEIHPMMGRISIINENYIKHKRTFNVPVCCENFNLFDENGMLITSDPNQVLYYISLEDYLRELKSKGETLAKIKKFQIDQLIKNGDNINNIDLFISIADQIHWANSKYYLVALFNNICDGCTSGVLIKKLNEIHKSTESSISLLIYLLDSHNEIDLKNLKTHLRLDLDIRVADSQMSRVWRKWIDEFGENQLNNILCLINQNGQVLKIMAHDSPNKFFSKLSKI
jgi:hypothetical protein